MLWPVRDLGCSMIEKNRYVDVKFNIKYVLEYQVVMMVGWVKTVLVLGRHF